MIADDNDKGSAMRRFVLRPFAMGRLSEAMHNGPVACALEELRRQPLPAPPPVPIDAVIRHNGAFTRLLEAVGGLETDDDDDDDQGAID